MRLTPTDTNENDSRLLYVLKFLCESGPYSTSHLFIGYPLKIQDRIRIP